MCANDTRQRRRTRGSVVGLGAALLVCAVGGGGCAGPQSIRPAPAPPAPVGRPHLSVACMPMRERAMFGEPLRIVFTIVNDGDWPVLLRGVTAQRPSDRSISWLESWRRPLRYDARRDELIATAPRAGGDYHRTLYRGLLLPGEALQAYTSVVPYARPSSHHRFRLDYLAAPADELLPRLLVAEPGGRDAKRRFHRIGKRPERLGVTRLRRAFMEGRPPHLSAASVPVAITLDPVTAPAQPRPIEVSPEIADPNDGLWLPNHGGWAFRRCSRGVVVIGRDGVRRLEHVSLEALRALACTDGLLEVRVIDEATWRKLRRLGRPGARDAEGRWLRIPRERAEELLALCAREGLWLDADPDAALPPGASWGGRHRRLRVSR